MGINVYTIEKKKKKNGWGVSCPPQSLREFARIAN